MSEELQRYCKKKNGNKYYEGIKIDGFEHYILGATTLKQLKQADIIDDFVNDISFPARLWNGTPSQNSKPDEIILDNKQVILVIERKSTINFKTLKQEEVAAEQCLTYMQQVHAKLGVVTDYQKFLWITDPENNSAEVRHIYDSNELFFQDYRQPGIIKKVQDELDPKSDAIHHLPAVDPSSLADSVWQTIWLATHEEPKLCLATFVEFFLYKFLSDLEVLPINLRIDKLNIENKKFIDDEGITQIEYYCQKVRPVLKRLFPERHSFIPTIPNFKTGSDTTSIIDGFAFLEQGIATHNHPLQTFNSSFMSIVKSFVEFGNITKIDSEFKSKVYEKFLRKNSKQKKLGQYLTPRTIVRAILGMSNPIKLMREQNASICDPACGVGGFLLEPLLHENFLKRNLEVDGNKVNWKVELVGMEVDRQTNILAKANLLIHLAEVYKELNKKQKSNFVNLMNQTFLLTDRTKMLGALEFPQTDSFDLILSNPPFTVRGTKAIKKQIAESEKLKEKYNQAGTGTESLFLRWIVDAIKPNGRAFVIVPTGILTRTETSVRSYILKKCILDAIISLPGNTFYNTINPTYILCFTKKSNQNEQQKAVFSYIVREIEETRDTLRLPCQTDLPDLIRQFRAFYADKEVFVPRNLNCKIIEKEKLNAEERWDVDRFWNEEEKRELGLIEGKSAITLTEFESLVDTVFTSIKDEIKELLEE